MRACERIGYSLHHEYEAPAQKDLFFFHHEIFWNLKKFCSLRSGQGVHWFFSMKNNDDIENIKTNLMKISRLCSSDQ